MRIIIVLFTVLFVNTLLALEKITVNPFLNLPENVCPIDFQYSGFFQFQGFVQEVNNEYDDNIDLIHFWNFFSLKYGDTLELFAIYAPTFNIELFSLELRYQYRFNENWANKIRIGKHLPPIGGEFQFSPFRKPFAQFARLTRNFIVRDIGVVNEVSYKNEFAEYLLSTSISNGDEAFNEKNTQIDNRYDIYADIDAYFFNKKLLLSAYTRIANKIAIGAYLNWQVHPWISIDAEIFHSEIVKVTEWYSSIYGHLTDWLLAKFRFEYNDLDDPWQITTGINVTYFPIESLEILLKLDGVFTDNSQTFIAELNFIF